MAENSSISWTDDTFNPWEGCQKVGPGCDNCYAEARNARYGAGVASNWGPGAPRRRTSKANWRKPLKWNREAKAALEAWRTNPFAREETPRPTRFVFCASLADVFDNAVPTQWRRDLFNLIRSTPHLTWLLLTKRPGNIVKMARDCYEPWREPLVKGGMQQVDQWWPRNAAIGCTVVTQEEADRDIPRLLRAKSELRPAFAFLSMEPLLGPVDFARIPWRFNAMDVDAPGAPVKTFNPLTGEVTSWDRGFPVAPGERAPAIDWIIAGGESGSKARPSHPDWFREVAGQCAEAGVPFHFKQWGEWTPGENVPASPRRTLTGAYVSDDGTWHETRFTDRESQELHYDDQPDVWRVGKACAGRRLDGAQHDARPEVAR